MRRSCSVGGTRRTVCIIIQNLSVPMDRRVWLECQALRDAGYEVSVICPRDPGQAGFEWLDGVAVHRYVPKPACSTVSSYLREFGWAWLSTAWLSVRVARRSRLDVLQTCNPPDTYWALALAWKALTGTQFVYDQHDLCPEMFASRFGDRKLLHRVLLLLERLNYAVADHVIVTNDSYRAMALGRGSQHPTDVTVVRSGPDTTVMTPGPADPSLRPEGRRLCCYLGIMGPQDGVDVLLDAWAVLIHDLRRTDVHLALLGFGDCYDDLCARAVALGLQDFVTFTGRVGPVEVERWLRSADVGLCPDPYSPYNAMSTTNKTMEYMAYGLPVVTFDLHETRVSAAEAGVYVAPGDVEGFARAIAELLDDEDERRKRSVLARRRAVAELDWAPQAARYVGVFDQLTDRLAEPGRVVDIAENYAARSAGD